MVDTSLFIVYTFILIFDQFLSTFKTNFNSYN